MRLAQRRSRPCLRATTRCASTFRGSRNFATTGVRVSEDNVLRVNSLLEVGQVTDTVTVSAGVAVLQTDRADVRTEIPAAQLENLPVPVGRNYQSLFVTVPGISPPENMHSVAVNPARGLAFSSNGTTRNANAIRIEGAISNNLWLPHVAAYVPALEAIESVGVTTSTFDADQGLSGGMSANVLIKSGTNELHGSALRIFLQRSDEVAAVFPARPTRTSHRPGRTSSAARRAGPSSATSSFFLEATRARSTSSSRSDSARCRRPRCATATSRRRPTPIYDPATGNASTGAGRTAFTGNIDSARPIRSDRPEADRRFAAAEPAGTRGQLLRDRATTRSIATTSTRR